LLYYTFRYRTLRYRFDDEGVTMSWGALFRREISLTYGRIQDIHLVSNLVERWLGLARVQIQTAAGSATAEMVVEGFREFERIRDFLYSRMRGARKSGRTAEAPTEGRGSDVEAVEALREAAREIRELRRELAGRRMGAPGEA
jgi:putative membrane protein